MRGTVLVVDDDIDAAEELAEALRHRDFRATTESDPVAALEDAMTGDVEVVLTDLQMRSLDGLAVCTRIVEARPDLPVVVVTGHASVDAAVGALRAGAFDFIVKPADGEILALTLSRAISHHRLKTEIHRLRNEVAEHNGFAKLLGESTAMRRLFDVIARIAPTQATVLVTGESGTGKELVARAIHEAGSRREGPFVAVNCAAVPATLLESELFGHAKGAFTDAKASRRGLFLEAQGGTLFLDEIGEMPLEMQVKLLRALQEHTVRAVGGTGETPFDARVVAATNKDLEREVAERRFREDLFYRIHVCSVDVPPLRDRDGDVPLLVRAFVRRFAEKHEKAVHGIAAPALAKLVQYQWPGNVRELENSIERAVAMAQFDQLVVEDLPERVRAYRPTETAAILPSNVAALVTADELERRYIQHVLQLVRGNKSRAARILGYNRRTLYRKLHRSEHEAARTEQRPTEVDAAADVGAEAAEESDAGEHFDDAANGDAKAALPATAPHGSAGPTNGTAATATGVSGSKPSILVVDDDGDVRELLQIVLEARGYVVHTASSLAEAIRMRDVDVVLTDVYLQDGVGTDLVGRFGSAPVVAISGRPLDHLSDAGFGGFLSKPVSVERLTATLASVLDR